MNSITIDSHVRIPRPKKAIADDERRRKLLKRYADTYQVLYMRKPDRYTFDAPSKIMRIYVGNSMTEAGSEAIIERRIRQMQQRIQDRE